MKTRSLKAAEIRKDWYVADAEGKTLGRFASEIAKILRGKHRPTFTPHMDMGDFVVVVNAEKVEVSGKKEMDKTYF
jgi:large subunit ribosomal protein L13